MGQIKFVPLYCPSTEQHMAVYTKKRFI